MKKNHQKQLAFSLLEVNIVVILLAIVMGISYKFFIPLYQKRQLNFTVAKITSQIYFLRSQAIIHQSKYSAYFQDHILYVEKNSPAFSYQVVYNPKYSYRLNKSRMNFFPNGRASFLSVFISDNIHTTRIFIASTGRLRVVKVK